ncbi:interleukin-20 receptor subunit alpha isoform X3 [Aptenodytes patagonicus]|uniref:interleukin-20 receptor subunit alpha isoform X3 n=1 Tax=Aptenodytes patagonicus TaxID=9234 RepID=UPI003F9F7675
MGAGQPRRGAAWLLLLLPLLLPPPPAAHTGELYCSLPNPRNVHFESINMKNVLHWSAPEGIGDGVLYKVKYSVYGVGKWIRKPECRNINRTWCDLSSETSDYEEQYYASVKAFLSGMCSNWTETTRFNPLTDTKIDPPMVSVSSTEKSISIILTAPEKWKRSPEGESISLLQVYPGLQYNVSVLNKKTKKRVWHYTDKCKEGVFIPCEKIVVNIITVNVDECKPSQESNHLSERKSPRYYSVYNGTEGKNLPSKEVLETKHLLDISHEEFSHEEDILVEGDQTGNWPSYGQTGTKNTLRQKSAETVEYEYDVRAEDFSPGQKLEDLSLKDKTSAPRGLLGEPQIALGDLVNMKTGQPYCPQLEVRAADPCLGQKTEELNLKMVDAADELPGETHINLVDLGTEKSGQTSYPQLEKIAQGLTEKDGEQTILVDWDPHTGRLYIPTLSSVENQVCEGVFKCDDPDKEGILSRLYEKEVSDESSEDQEMYLLQFKEQWGLHVELED